MKNNIKILLASTLLLTFAFFASCDKIDEPFVKQTGSVDTSQGNFVKRVLLEDYTGHGCVNCPTAAIIAHDLKQEYGEKLVLLTIHAGWFAKPIPPSMPYDFQTEAGTAWDLKFGIGNAGNPNGMVNRIGLPSNHIVSPSGWRSAISKALATDPLVDLQIVNKYDTSQRKLDIQIETLFITNVKKNLKLVVVLTESGIIQPQKNNNPEVGNTPLIEKYEHNHVLRSAISSTWGSSIAEIGTANPESVVKSFKYTLKDEFVPENCTVVAFIYDEDTNEVLQAVEGKVL